MAKFFLYPWATAGDKAAIQDAIDPSGVVTYYQGHGADYARDPATDPLSKAIERDKMNQLHYDITSNIRHYQTNTFPEFITSADNGGTAFPYDVDAIVRYNPGTGYKLYRNNTAGNTNIPTGSGWVVYSVEAITHASTEKTTPADSDEFALVDSAASFGLKRLTWANLKSAIGTFVGLTYAPIASPTFTGNPTAPTPSAGDNDTSIATTAFVSNAFLSMFSTLSKPTRISGTTYTNSLNKSKMVFINVNYNGSTFSTTFYVNGVITGTAYLGATVQNAFFSAVIPTGSTYSVSAGLINVTEVY